MHAAPPVSFPAGRSRVAAILLAILSGLALAAAVAWLLAVPVAGWRQGGAFAAWLAVVLIAWRGWLASATGLLRWDGAGWTWSPGADAEVSGAPTIALDL